MVKKTFLVFLQFVFAYVPQIYLTIFLNKEEFVSHRINLLFFTVIVIINLSIAIIFFKKKSGIKLNFRNIKIVDLLYYFIVGLCISFVCNFFANTVGYVNPDAEKSVYMIINNLPKLLIFLVVAISGPILEELAARGMIMGYLFNNQKKIGFVVSLVLFIACHHPSSVGQIIAYSGPALALCYIYYSSERVEYSIAYHMLNNLFSVL